MLLGCILVDGGGQPFSASRRPNTSQQRGEWEVGEGDVLLADQYLTTISPHSTSTSSPRILTPLVRLAVGSQFCHGI